MLLEARILSCPRLRYRPINICSSVDHSPKQILNAEASMYANKKSKSLMDITRRHERGDVFAMVGLTERSVAVIESRLVVDLLA
jgi:hypothetical protein